MYETRYWLMFPMVYMVPRVMWIKMQPIVVRMPFTVFESIAGSIVKGERLCKKMEMKERTSSLD